MHRKLGVLEWPGSLVLEFLGCRGIWVLGVGFERPGTLVLGCIPHICHGRHREYPCKTSSQARTFSLGCFGVVRYKWALKLALNWTILPGDPTDETSRHCSHQPSKQQLPHIGTYHLHFIFGRFFLNCEKYSYFYVFVISNILILFSSLPQRSNASQRISS